MCDISYIVTIQLNAGDSGNRRNEGAFSPEGACPSMSRLERKGAAAHARLLNQKSTTKSTKDTKK
jgi:hypothetical protein